MPTHRPSSLLLSAWVGLSGLTGAATGLMVAWYGGLVWVLVSLPREQQPGGVPPDVLDRMEHVLRPSLVPVVLLGVVAAVVAHRAVAGDRSPQRWRHRAWQLGGVSVGALVGVLAAVALVGAWSVLTVSLSPDVPPPSVASQAEDVVVFGLLIVIPLAFALIGRWFAPVLGGRADRRDPTT